MYHIESALKNLRAMVHNKTMVEGCIAEEFKMKETAYFTSVYFTEHLNINAPTMWCQVDEDIPCSDLQIFLMDGNDCWCLHAIPANSARADVCFALHVCKYG
jgi:hypothetical protein